MNSAFVRRLQKGIVSNGKRNLPQVAIAQNAIAIEGHPDNAATGKAGTGTSLSDASKTQPALISFVGDAGERTVHLKHGGPPDGAISSKMMLTQSSQKK